jgi:hypothetical protein
MLADLIRSLSRRSTSAASPRKSRRPAPQFLEALESRLLLNGIGPGNAVVALTGGKLTITGDDYSNSIEITTDGTNLSVAGSSSTINGASVPFTTPLVQITGDVKIQLRDGSDRVSIASLNFPKNLAIDLGEGDNVTTISNCTIGGLLNLTATAGDDAWRLTGVAVTKNFAINSGEGDDTLEVQSSAFVANVSIRAGFGYDSIDCADSDFAGNVAIVNGDGGSDVAFNRVSGSPRIHGNLSVTSGEGTDYVTLNTASVDGKIDGDFGHGSGDHGLLLNNSSVGKDISLKSLDGMGLYDFNNAHVTGNVKISSQYEEGSALFRNGTTITGNVALAGGATPMGLRLTGATIGGNFSLVNGSGQSNLTINSSTGTTEIGGKFTLQCGNGNTSLAIDGADFAGAVKVTMGSGDNTIAISGVSAFNSTADIKVAGGRTQLTIDTATFIGAVTINTGAGHDTIAIDDSTFSGQVKINTGAGNDQLHVDTGKEENGPITWFKNALTASLGSGSDSLLLGAGTGGRMVRFSVASRIDCGAGIDIQYTHLDGAIIPTILSGEIVDL